MQRNCRQIWATWNLEALNETPEHLWGVRTCLQASPRHLKSRRGSPLCAQVATRHPIERSKWFLGNPLSLRCSSAFLVSLGWWAVTACLTCHMGGWIQAPATELVSAGACSRPGSPGVVWLSSTHLGFTWRGLSLTRHWLGQENVFSTAAVVVQCVGSFKRSLSRALNYLFIYVFVYLVI